MNFSVVYNNSTLANPGARGNALARNYQGIRASSYTTTAGQFGINTAMYGAETYSFNDGDVVNYTVTTNQSTGGFTSNGGVSIANDGSFTQTAGQSIDAVRTYSGSLTFGPTTNAIYLQIRRNPTTANGSFVVSATCTPAAVAPSVTTQPVSQTVSAGAIASFSVQANGTPSPTVQWQVSSDSGATFTNIGGATSPNYGFTAGGIDSGKQYRAVFTNSAGTATTSAATLTVVSATQLSSTSGPEAGGTPVTITGTGFAADSTVTFNSVAATGFTFTSPTQISVTSPAGTGTVNVRVTTNGATSQAAPANAFTYVAAPPVITSISPTGGSTGGGTPVTITGSNFVAGNAYTASFGPNTVAATYASATTLTATAPAGTGSVQVTVTNTTNNQAGTGSATFAYAAPTVTAISPNSGPASQARTVTITGTNFTPSAIVSVGSTAATSVTYVDATQLSAALPAKAAGIYDVLVTTGAVTTASSANARYTYISAPTIASITPTSGTTAGGTLVTIAGSNFAGATAVTFGGDAATDIVVAGDGSSLTARTPARAAGAVTVVVTTPGGSAQQAGGYTYVVLSAPTVQTQPANQEVAVGATATFSASGNGSPTPTAQWQSAPTGSNTFTNINGETGPSYTTPATAPGDNGRQYRVVFSNSEGTATSNAAMLTVVQAPTANPQAVNATFNTATAITLTGTDPNTPARPLTYTVATQPAHGTLSGAAPNLTYTPNANYTGADSFTFTVSNGVVTSAAATIGITVGQGNQTITFTSTPPANARVRGATYTVTATASSGQPVTFTSSTTNVCTISGATVTFIGAGTCTIAANQAGNTTYAAAPEATQSFTVNGPAIAVSPPSGGLPSGTVGTAYSITASASGGTAPYSYAITAGALPPGFTLDQSSGRFGGTPTRGGSYGFTVTATDSTTGTGAPFTGSAAYTLLIQAPTIVIAPETLANATGAEAYSQQLTASGGTAPYSYAVTAGTLPAGVTLSAGGLLSGTPAQSGNFDFTVTATDGSTGGPAANGGYIGTRNYRLTVGAPTITIAPNTIRSPQVGVPYSQALTASGGSGSYTFALRQGSAFPAGLSISPNGVISGTATEGGLRQFAITATDANGFSAVRTYQVNVQAATIAIAPATLPDGARGTSYSQTLTASGGTAPYVFSVTAGALPAGLTLAADGMLAGQPSSVGSFTFTVTARDSSAGNGPFAGNRTYTLTVSAAAIGITPDTLPAGTTRVAYSQTLTANGGTGPYTYAVTAGALPGGITLAPGGTLSGSATTAGTFNFNATVTDSFGNAGSRGYTLTIATPAITLAPSSLPAATSRVAYSQAITASGGTGPYTFAVTAGALPAGLTLSTSGTLSGSATVAGDFIFTVTATDANGNVGSRGYTLTVAAPAIVIAPEALPAGTTRVAYSQTLTASGGRGPYAYAVTAGALPAGITLATLGELTGTPTAAGSFNFTVTVTDLSGNTGTRSYTLAIAAPTIVLAPAALPDAAVGTAYIANLTASGGTAPYRYAVTAGSLPAGIALGADGALSGTATAGGTANFTVSATDANGNVGSRSYSLTVAAAVVTIAPAQLPAGTTGTAYAQTLTAAGGTAPYSFAVTSGALPGGLTLAAGGTVSGTPTAAGSFTFGVTATDSSAGTGPYRGTQTYTLTIGQQAQTITFANPGTKRLSDSPITLAATASSGLAVSYASTTTGVCTVSGNSVTLVTTGTCTIVASQAGNANFAAAADVTQSFRVDAALLVATVAQPSVTATVGVPLSATAPVTASGGQTPYGYALSTTLPAGLSFSASTGQISGTPTAGRAATGYTVTVTDAGGQTATGQFTLTVAAPTIAVTPTTLPAARQTIAYSQQLSATGGTAPYSYAVTAGTLPAGLTLSVGGLISGTPTTSATASDFTVTATDSSTGTGPFTGAISYRLAVDLPPPPTVTAVPTASTPGTTTASTTPVQIPLTDYVRGEFTDVELSGQPANGTVSLNRTGGATNPRVVATYTPRLGFSGTDSFGFVAVGPGGRSAVASVAVTVAGQAPVIAPLTAQTTQGVPVTIDLTAAATGGPFTAARVVSATPAGSVATQIVEDGSGNARRYRLTITPTLTFSGTATVSYAVSNAFGESTPASISVAVAARPDPTADAAVNGMSLAQAEATRRFATAQIQNFARRNEQLHNGGSSTSGFSSSLSLSGGDSATATSRANEDDFMLAVQGRAREIAGAELARGELVRGTGGGLIGQVRARGRDAAGSRGGVVAGPVAVAGAQPTDADGQGDGESGRRVGSVAIWSGGAIAVGTRDATTDRDKLSVSTGGLSSGIDLKVTPRLIVGVGGGYGGETTKINGGQARVEGNSWSIAGYGSWTPIDGVFIDGIFGGGRLDFDTRRRVAATGAIARGSREGDMLFGSAAFGFDRRLTTLDLSLYGRVDWLSADLDRYTEVGGGIYGLTFGKRDLTSLASVLGGRASVSLGGATGKLRGEWRHEFNATGSQLVDYADIVNLRYRARGDGWLRNVFSLDLGVDAPLGAGWSGGIEVGASGGKNALIGTGRVELRKQF